MSIYTGIAKAHKLWPNKDQTVSLDAGIAALSGSVEIELDSLEGSFDVSMNIFEDAAFEIPAGENFTGNF